MKKSKNLKKQILIFLLTADLIFFIPFSINSASYYQIGDVNHDEKVTIIDSLLVAQYTIGISDDIDTDLADVNGDEEIDILDALLIAQYYIKIIPDFPRINQFYRLYEAEEAQLTGGVKISTDHTGFTGNGYINELNAIGACVLFNITIPRANHYKLQLKYCGTGGPQAINLYINNLKYKTLSLNSTAGNDEWDIYTEDLLLNVGSNVIGICYDKENNSNICLDYITLTAPDNNEYIINAGNGKLKINICTDRIIHVQYSPDGNFPQTPSLITDKTKWPLFNCQFTQTETETLIQTPRLKIKINNDNNAIGFTDLNNQTILNEEVNGREINSATYPGESGSYTIGQKYKVTNEEAFYGLGQHQNGIANYLGTNLRLVQCNGESAVPFLISTKGYGLLWDNYSDTRLEWQKEQPEIISAKNFFDDSGAAGGLTGRYYNGENYNSLSITRIDKEINFDWGGKSPATELPYDGYSIRWTGEILTEETGNYQFLTYSDDGVRLWVNNQIIIDNWTIHSMSEDTGNIKLEANTRYSIKLEYYEHTFNSIIQLKWRKPSMMNNYYTLRSNVADTIDYYLIYGPEPDLVIKGYRDITGEAPLFPKWAYGFIQGRDSYSNQTEIINTAQEFRRRKIPVDAILQSGAYWGSFGQNALKYDPAIFPAPQEMINTIHQLNMHYMIGLWPKFDANTDAAKILSAGGYILTGTNNTPLYDAYNEKAGEIYWQYVKPGLYDYGVDSWWLNKSEPEVTDASDITQSINGIYSLSSNVLGSFYRYLNPYPLVNARNIFSQQRETTPDKRVMIISRAAFTGMQKYAAAVSSGEIKAGWDEYKKQITAGINFSLSGIPYWTTDIGGYEVNYPTPGQNLEYQELYSRWYQFGAFCPIFRSNGKIAKECWNFGYEGDMAAYDAQLTSNKLRYRLLPYIYSLARKVTRDGYTIMRGLPFDFAFDEKTLNITDQFMFGPFMLINPVTIYQAVSRPVYLPAGSWYNFWQGTFYKGGQTISVETPFTKIPIFIKAGSILPLGPHLQYAVEKPADPLEIRVYQGNNAQFDLYEDENDNYNYKNGTYSVIPMNWDQNSQTLTIGARQGSFNGMLQKRIFHIVWVRSNIGSGLNEAAPDIIVNYAGQEISLKPGFGS